VPSSWQAGDDLSFDIDSLSPIYFIIDGVVSVDIADRTAATPRTRIKPDQAEEPESPDGRDSGYDTNVEGGRPLLSAGDMFGHLSLFTGRSAHCHVICVEDCTLLQLSRSDMNSVLNTTTTFKDSLEGLQRAMAEIWGNHAELSRVERILPHLHPTYFEAGADISFDIDPWSPLYYITTGRVEISYWLDSRAEELKDVLEPGDFLPDVLWYRQPQPHRAL